MASICTRPNTGLSLPASPGASTFSVTIRPSRSSRARYATAIPSAPSDSPPGTRPLVTRPRARLAPGKPSLNCPSPPQSSPVPRRPDWCSRRSRRAPSDQRESRRSPGAIWAAITRQGIVWPRRNSPVRGVAPMTTPNQRPRISQPSIRMSTPVSSSRHNCHRSSLCAMPATAAKWGRSPARRRAAISTSAGVRTLTTTAWARAALDDHRGGSPRKASHAMATA